MEVAPNFIDQKMVYLLWHKRPLPEDDAVESKLIGVFPTEPDAVAAQVATAPLPGFVDYPECFLVEPLPLDVDLRREN